MNLFTMLASTATRFPDKGAVYRGDARVYTYRELSDRVRRLAATLSAEGRPGDRLMVASANHCELIVIMYAAWAAGMAYAPINAKLHPREMAPILQDAAPRWIFASAELAAAMKSEGWAGAAPIVIGSPAYAAMFGPEQSSVAAVAPDALAWLFYTSGTTGRSKGAMLSCRNLAALTLAHLADFEDLNENDSLIHAAPMSHGSGLYVPPYIARGARHVVPVSAGYDPAEFLALCDRHPGCGAFLAPTMVQRLRQAVEATGRKPAHLRSILYGGGPMYLDEIKRSLACFGPIFRHLYGQGEAPMTITGVRQRDFEAPSERVLASVGWPRTGVEVRVVDDDFKPAPAGALGEIVCRGDVVMGGYWRDPGATIAALRGGWLQTGDLGSMSEDGLLTLRDRSKAVIISGGTNIYPREVEEVLLAHPGVREAAVLGAPDAEWGEVVVAAVALESGVTATADELDELCLGRIARFKRPRRYLFLADLPKSSYGKILKRDLLAQFPCDLDRREG